MRQRPEPVADGPALPEDSTPADRVRGLVKRAINANEIVLLLILVVLALLIQYRNDNFLTSANLTDIARAASFTLIVAVAATFVLISGSIDLSVGSIFGLGGVICGLALQDGWPVVAAIVVGLGAGAAVGAINGFIIVKLGVPALITTLGSLYAVSGLVLVLTTGNPVYDLPANFNSIGQGELLGLPNPVWIALGVVVLAQVCLSRTVFGRQLYSVGGSERAAYLAGAPIRRIRFSVFVLSGTAAALGGVLIAARVGSAQVNAGQGLELTVIAAAIIGGTSLFGGSGNVIGTVLGALLIGLIANGLVLASIDPFWQNIVVGTIIVVAVGLDTWRRRRLAER
jgi:ribose/xylose/arabinose/galactoside ABC-type transport system permease subunit